MNAPETRGRTDIADRVLERIATRALTEVDQARGSAPRVLGVPLGRNDAQSAPRVDVHVDSGLATLEMTISVVYPASIRRVASQLRDRVAARVNELTGLEVRQVDINVASLIRTDRGAGRAR